MPLAEVTEQTALDNEEKKLVIDTHNFWRKDVGVQEELQWSDDLAKVAAKWAIELKKKDCGFEHSPDNPYGENLFKGTVGFFDAKQVVDAWAGEKAFYNYNKNKCKPGEMCGHYTQIIWQSTQHVGCAKIECDGFEIWVCEYDPPGNWVGQKPY